MKIAVNVYDFDHTIYRGDASLDFIAFCMLRHPRTWLRLPTQCIAFARYILGARDRKRIKQAAFAILQDINNIDPIIHKFWDSHEHKIHVWYMAQKQPNDLIISASPEFLLKPLVEKLGVGTIIATRMDSHTGQIEGANCRAEEKLRRLQAYDKALVIDAFYSDSLSDLPLLRLARKPYLVKRGVPKRFDPAGN